MAEKQEQNFKHIVRVANVDIPGNVQTRVALTKIKGIGVNFADMICTVAKVDKRTKAGYLNDDEVARLNAVAQHPLQNGLPAWSLNRRKDYDSGTDLHVLTGTLNFVKDNDLKKLKKIKTLRGIRHQKGLPVRGQRTRSNFRRSKGKVVGVTKKAAAPQKSAAKTPEKPAKKEKK